MAVSHFGIPGFNKLCSQFQLLANVDLGGRGDGSKVLGSQHPLGDLDGVSGCQVWPSLALGI